MNPVVTPRTISVVICAFTERRMAHLCAAIRSVQQQTLPSQAIIVVIDHNPELFQRVRAQFPDIEVIASTEPRGLSGARNCGVAHATSDIVAFLDDDAEADPAWLAQIQAAFTDPQVMGVGGRVMPQWASAAPAWFPREFLWVVGCSYQGLPTAPRAIRNPIGANMAFRREVFQIIGGFRTEIGRVGTLPLGCEETELSIRAHQQWPDHTILYLPDAVVRHHVPQGRARWRYYASRCYAEGVSKAAVARLVGAQPSLASERAYTTRTLPAGVARGLGDTLRGDLSGIARAWAIMLGLCLTVWGYLRGSLHRPRPITPPADVTVTATPDFYPRRMIETDLAAPLPDLSAFDPETGQRYAFALCLLRLHGHVLGLVEVALGEDGVSAEEYAEQIWYAVQQPINEHLSADGLAPLARLTSAGIRSAGTLLCEEAQRRRLVRAPYASVIVTAHGDEEVLRRSLSALIAQNYPLFEIIIIDSNGSVALRELVDALDILTPPIRYISCETPGQCAGLRNRAVTLAIGDILAFTDDTAIPDPEWLAQLAQPFAAKEVACVTGLALPRELETPAQQWFEEYGGFSKGFVRRTFTLAEHGPLYPFNAGHFGTSINMAVRAAFLRAHGGFDAALDASFDLALFRTVILAGQTIVYTPDALVRYDMPRSYSALYRRIKGFGRGLGAYIAQTFLAQPRVALRGLSKILPGVYYLLSPWSDKNRKRSQWYPRELARVERRGIVRGAWGYLGARLRHVPEFRATYATITPPEHETTRIMPAVALVPATVPVHPARALVRRLGEQRSLLLNGFSMIGTTGVTSLLGFLYWWAAARRFTPEAVGFASALVSVISLLGLLCMFGFGTLLMAELKREPERREALLAAALLFVAGAAGAAGLAFAALAPLVSPSFAPLGANIGVMLFFALAVSLSAVTLVLDQALVGLLLGGQQLWRNTVFAVVKLALLVGVALLVAPLGGLAIFATWVAGFVISLAVLIGYGIAKGGITRQSLRPDWPRLRRLWAMALQHHLVNTIQVTVNQLLPIIVTISLSVRANAWFYLSFSLANLVFMIAYSLSTALYAVNAADTNGLTQRLRITVGVSAVACVVANIIVLFSAPYLLGIYGPAYALMGAWSLRILCLGAFPEIIRMHYVALQRIRGTLNRALVPLAIGAIAEIVCASVGAHTGGLTGLCLGWIIALTGEALYMAPTVFRALRAESRQPQVRLVAPARRLAEQPTMPMPALRHSAAV